MLLSIEPLYRRQTISNWRSHESWKAQWFW